MILEMTTSGLISLGALSRASSETARYVQNKVEESRRQLNEVYSLGDIGKGVLSELHDVAERCREANWDGYGASPVSNQAIVLASHFLAALPLGTSAPSVGAEPDGHITVEWHRALRRTLSVSVSPDGDLHYAALLPGSGKAYGSEPFFDNVPSRILGLIHAVSAL